MNPEKLISADRPSVFRRSDGIVQFRPSEIGKCMRSLVACLLGHKPEPFDEQTKRILKMGNILEPAIAYDFENIYGGRVLRQIALNLPIDNFAEIVGQTDGIWFPDASEVDLDRFDVINNGTRFDPETIIWKHPYSLSSPETHPVAYLIEIKAPGDSMFLKMSREGPSLAYRWQKSCYHAMAEYCLGIKLAGIVFIMGRRGDLLSNYEFIDFPEFSVEQITQRCRAVIDAAEKGLGEGSIDCDQLSFFCNYWKIHKKKEGDSVGQAATKNKKYEFDYTIQELALDYYLNKSERETLEVIEKGLKEELNKAMRDRDKVKTPGFSLYFGSHKFLNARQLMLDRPDLAEKYTKFDAEAAVDSEEGQAEGLREKYSMDGDKFLTVRPVKKELERILAEQEVGKKVKAPKLIHVSKLGAEEMESFMDSIIEKGKIG